MEETAENKRQWEDVEDLRTSAVCAGKGLISSEMGIALKMTPSLCYGIRKHICTAKDTAGSVPRQQIEGM